MISTEYLDAVILGAGISGIDVASYLKHSKYGFTFAVLERRAEIGGTWSFFKYPGLRSDSDMFTFGYEHRPWPSPKPIADAKSILEYLNDTIDKNEVRTHIRMNHHVKTIHWCSEDTQVHLESGTSVDVPANRWLAVCSNGKAFISTFLFGCLGYYSQDKPNDPIPVETPGIEEFKRGGGVVVHAQRWTADTQWKGKDVVVVGSGATAITAVPAIARDAKSVTMVQRSPSYVLAIPNLDPIAAEVMRQIRDRGKAETVAVLQAVNASFASRNEALRAKICGDLSADADDKAASDLYQQFFGNLSDEEQTAVHSHIRMAKVIMTQEMQKQTVTPQENKEIYRSLMRQYCPQDVMTQADFDVHFNPSYYPWEQRVCMAPDGDFFKALQDGKARMVTGKIERFTGTGLQMVGGRDIPADLVLTATGFNMHENAPMADMQVFVDGEPYVARDHYVYKGCMLDKVPNFIFVMGYFRASWTLKADLVAKFALRILEHMKAEGKRVACARLRKGEVVKEAVPPMTSGYIQRAAALQPKIGAEGVWAPLDDYLTDRETLKGRLEDENLRFEVPGVFGESVACGSSAPVAVRSRL